MRRVLRALSAIGCVGVLIGCSASKGTEPKQRATGAAIESETDAKIAFGYLKAEAEQIDARVKTNFAAPLSIAGLNGSASVSGSKTSTSSSSSSSTYSSRISDLNVSFAAFQSSAGAAAVSGVIRWTDYSDSRTACSISTCASSSHHSQSLEGSSIALAYDYAGKSYSDRVTVNASRNNVSSFSVALTNGAGRKFSFSYP